MRIQGHYRLKFTLMDLGSYGLIDSRFSSDSTHVCHSYGSIMTNPFTAFAPNKFPGVIKSSELFKAFVSQGANLQSSKARRKGSDVAH